MFWCVLWDAMMMLCCDDVILCFVMMLCRCDGVMLLWWCYVVRMLCCDGVRLLWWCYVVMMLCYVVMMLCCIDVMLLWWCNVDVMMLYYMLYCVNDLCLSALLNVLMSCFLSVLVFILLIFQESLCDFL